MHTKKNEQDMNTNAFEINYGSTNHCPKIFLTKSHILNISFIVASKNI